MIVNYMQVRARTTRTNIRVAQALVGILGAWIVLSYDFAALAEFPTEAFASHRRYGGVAPPLVPRELLVVEQLVVAVLLMLVACGWRIRLTALSSALLLMHLGAVIMALSNLKVFAFLIYPLIMFSVHDGVGRTEGDVGQAEAQAVADADCLRAIQLATALIYFLTGWAKVNESGWAWLSPSNLQQVMVVTAEQYLRELPLLGQWVVASPYLAVVASAATIVLELGFLVVLLLRLPLWPMSLGLMSLHVAIFLAMGINYAVYLGILHLLFVAWDRIPWSQTAALPPSSLR
jgi:hypothetical protein